MAKSKERPLDRYPYMENNLKGWDNWFVTNEVYAVNQKIIHDRLDYLQEEIDNIELHGYVTDEEFNEYKAEVTGNFTTINSQITNINTRLNNLPNIYVTQTTFNEFVESVNDLTDRVEANETKIDKIKFKTIVINPLDAVEDTSVQGFMYKKEVSVSGITADTFVDGFISAGSYNSRWQIESDTDKIILRLCLQATNTATRITVYYSEVV